MVPDSVVELVARFEQNRQAYQSGQYNETQLRREFLDPLFKALGWDVDNEQGYAEAYKDVIHEDAIKVGGVTKAPDYCFRIGGRRVFFLEAKKPSVNVRDEVAPAYQLRRYAWSAKLPLSILTDFEELAVYDCRIKPAPSDKASTGRILYLNSSEYAARWDELAAIFSREAVLKGSFDKFAESTRLKRGTAEVDAAFLADIEAWRDVLARNFALRNPALGTRELNFAVQRTIDRVIFLRMCEDRGVEHHGQLAALTNGEATYRRLGELFRLADERYNSGLFHFEREKNRVEPPDELTQTLELDDKPLKDILRSLYYPESPYEFSVLPAEILGQVYEQFLGKVIRLTSGHRAVVDDKPEVKKAGGVYYTPGYIVDYIVRNTVGKLVEKQSPRQVARLRVVDPACGSGSFLVGAYTFLLDWHRDWYVADGAAKHAKEIYQGSGGQWYLTTAEKKRILLNSIYGVDIDAQAVEVTKLSLLLKVLEGENRESLERQRRFLHERALPDLGSNIKCGNSLIGPDFYNHRQLSLLDDEEQYRINAFDWRAEFPEVFKGKDGGFDAVIGNPPYIRIQALKEWAPVEVEYYKKAYRAAGKGNYDIYVVFVERGLGLLNPAGRLGFILPSKFLATDYGEALRGIITEEKSLAGLVDFAHEQVFAGATTYTCLLFLLRGGGAGRAEYLRVSPALLALGEESPSLAQVVDADRLGKAPWIFGQPGTDDLLQRLKRKGTRLLDLPTRISRGSSTGADTVFVLRQAGRRLLDQDGNSVDIEPAILRIPLGATDFNRYRFAPEDDLRIIFPYRVDKESYALFAEEELRSEYPRTYAYLRSKREVLTARKQFNRWYGFSAPRNLSLHDQANLLVPLLANRGLYAPMAGKRHRYCLMASGGFSISLPPDCAAEYVLGLLNSRLLYWNLQQISNRFRGGWVTCTKQYVGELPIRTIDFSNRADKARHDRLVELVQRMLELNRQLPTVRTPDQKTRLERQIATADRQIDRLVYELYGLSDDEIRIVEDIA
ncbi:MAG: Eco57I restriction-modification methylase domain-containing protein [Pirellulales bacterium]